MIAKSIFLTLITLATAVSAYAGACEEYLKSFQKHKTAIEDLRAYANETRSTPDLLFTQNFISNSLSAMGLNLQLMQLKGCRNLPDSGVEVVAYDSFESAAQPSIDATRTQIRGLQSALDLYKMHNGRYPTTKQSLTALLKRPTSGAIPKNWDGPYLRSKRLPLDAWDNHFIYASDKRGYVIISLGADGLRGGTGPNADISSLD